jgi:hypothetical protein
VAVHGHAHGSKGQRRSVPALRVAVVERAGRALIAGARPGFADRRPGAGRSGRAARGG